MNCEQFHALIVDLQDLRPGERTDLERHAEMCQGCGAQLEGFRGLMAALRTLGSPKHVEGERLTRFALYRAAPTEPDYDQVRLSEGEIQQIEGHIGACPRCQLAVDGIIDQYHEVDRLLDDAGIPPVPIVSQPSLWAFVRGELERLRSRAKSAMNTTPHYPTAGVALGVLLLVVLWMGPWLRHPYHELTAVEATETSFLTRDGSSALSRGIALMNEGRYSEANALLEPFSESEADERLSSYAHYLSGLASIYEARTELFGRVLAYNESRLDRAIAHLQTVTASGPSGRIQEDAYWLLGKAHLMKKDPDRALEAFTEVEQMDGRRAREARQLIRALQELAAD